MKRLTVSTEYCEKVGLAIGKSAAEVKKLIDKWWNDGQGIDWIKKMLICLAKDNGRKLIFVSKLNLN